jgi:hypothetical protein
MKLRLKSHKIYFRGYILAKKSEKAINIIHKYLFILLNIDERVTSTNKVIKVLVNSIYFIILTHLLSKLL